MTVSTTAYATTVAGNGATTVFNFAFIADNASTIRVTLTDVNGVQTVLNPNSYTLFINVPAVGTLWGIGGTVTYPLSGSPVPSTSTLTIERIVPYTQTVSIANQGAFYPQAVEQGLDLLELQLQQFQGQFTNTVRAPTVDGILDMTLPAVAARANKFLFFNLQGQPGIATGVPTTSIIGVSTGLFFLSNYATLALADAAASAAGGCLVVDTSITIPGNTTLNSKTVYFTGGIITRGAFNLTLNGAIVAGDTQIFDIAGAGTVTIGAIQKGINVKWFGAKGDNVTDDYTALTKCFTTAVASSQAKVFAPIGYYRLSRQLIISAVGLEGSSKVGTNFSALQPFTGDSVLLVDDSVSGGGTDSRYENFRIYGNRAQVSTTVAGLKLYGNVLYNTFTDIRIDEAKGAGILVEGKAGPVRPTLNTFTNVHVSSGDSDGLLMNAGRHMTFTDCAFENLGGKGVNIQGTTEACSKLTFITPYIEHITGDGIYLGATDLTTIISPLVNGYGSTGTPSYGIRNAGAAANLNELLGGQFAKNVSPHASSHDVYIDNGVRFSGRRLNTTDIVTVGNRGANFSNYQIAAASTSPLFFSNGRATIAAAATRYLGMNGAQSATRTDVDIPLPGYTCLSQLRVSTTAILAAGDTVDVLVLINGGVTALTCQLNNANGGRSNDLADEAFFVPGDLLAVRVITSGAAPTIAIDGLVISLGVRQA